MRKCLTERQRKVKIEAYYRRLFMKYNVRRILSLSSALALGAVALGAFAGCTTRAPKVTITYSFNGKDYAVRYTLSRNDAPKTVQHFLELANAGYYDGMCIHNYTSEAIYTGGYKLVENGGSKELQEVDYFSSVKKLEEEKGIAFTQSVWTADGKKTPLYTVYGEFSANGVVNQYAREYSHTKGALVMYYTPKGNFYGDVTVQRADGGKNNGGNNEQTVRYALNSATSLFYTYRNMSNTARDNTYCVFGMANADDYTNVLEKGLFAAIAEFEETLKEGDTFTDSIKKKLNEYEPFEDVQKEGAEETFQTPVDMPIIVKSVVINRY